MQVEPDFHLTYCSNIHPGERWQDVSAALASSLPRVRAALALQGPFGVGLRLSADAAETLDQPDAFSQFQRLLESSDAYVFTINGFPFGAFHGTRVKEAVYSPAWWDPARLEYTNRLARLQAALLAGHPEIEGSVSTVPGAFKPSIKSQEDVRAIAAAILQHAAHLVRLREESGVTITLALEPEPACLLETIDDAVGFFERYLFEPAALAASSRRDGVRLGVEDVRRHIGICFDACHMAVEFEPPAAALDRLKRAGIRVCKVQLSSALHVPDPGDAATRAILEQFAEDTYLHQVVKRCGNGLVRHTDLPEVLEAARRRSPEPGEEWRIHFHVPIFLAEAGRLQTTQPYLIELLGLLRRDPVCPYLEVETYTWEVLPPRLREEDVCVAIARELAWVRSTLGGV